MKKRKLIVSYSASINFFQAQMGSFAAFGFLPVLPGPCGFYKISYLLECAPFYHDFLSMEVEDIGVIDANLMIAEDRVREKKKLNVTYFF